VLAKSSAPGRSTIRAALEIRRAFDGKAVRAAERLLQNQPQVWNACLNIAAGEVLIEAGPCARMRHRLLDLRRRPAIHGDVEIGKQWRPRRLLRRRALGLELHRECLHAVS